LGFREISVLDLDDDVGQTYRQTDEEMDTMHNAVSTERGSHYKCLSLCWQNDVLSEFVYQYQPMTTQQLKMFNNEKYKYVNFFNYYSLINELLTVQLW